MELTKEILLNLKDSGKDICIYSKDISKKLIKYSSNDFRDFSRTSYYYWIKGLRPVPLRVIIRIIKEKKLKKINVKYFSMSGGNKLTFPKETNLYFCYILGLILGDGCLVHQKKDKNRNTYLVKITFREKKEAEIIKSLFKKLFEIESSIYLGRGCYDLCIYSKPLVLILNKKYQIPMGKKYGLICVPKLILNGNYNMKRAFLKGVFDSDGNVYYHNDTKVVQLRQKSGKFLSQLKNLFLEINIDFNNPYYDCANNSWVLWSSKKELVDNFINDIIEFNSMPG